MRLTKLQREQIEAIIREMMARDKGTIASEIGEEIQKRLGIAMGNKQINGMRRQIGLGTFDIIKRDIHKLVEVAMKERRRKLLRRS
jgi:hypothetical protein